MRRHEWQDSAFCEPTEPKAAAFILADHKCATRSAVFDCSCGVGLRPENCVYEGRCREPLAWLLLDNDHPVQAQDQCPLFTSIPSEIRILIWEFALTDCISLPPDRLRGAYTSDANDSDGNGDLLCPSDIAFSLLQTCRAVYLETYTLPFSLNPYVIVATLRFQGHRNLLSWQFANVQSLDIRIEQSLLEDEGLGIYVVNDPTWDPDLRHRGAYLAPRDAGESTETVSEDEFGSRTDFRLIDAEGCVQGRRRLADVLTRAALREACTTMPCQSDMRVALARPIKHLTLRINQEDWSTWEQKPNSPNEAEQLGLDPAGIADGSLQCRVTASRMRHLAEERRSGHLIDDEASDCSGEMVESTWSSQIAKFPDLISLELVLETFAREKAQLAQLDNVVECAKTWTFPIHGARRMLVWDGKVKTKNYSFVPVISNFSQTASLPPISASLPPISVSPPPISVSLRIVRFKSQRIA